MNGPTSAAEPPRISRLGDTKSIVTGAASGIGAATAVRLASEGSAVLAVDRDLDRLTEIYSGTSIDWIAQDVRGRELADLLYDRPFDVLVNAAGVLRRSSLLSHGIEDWDLTLDVNVKAVIKLTRAFARRHIEHKTPGAIVNVCSIESFTAAPDHAAYTVSKTALASLTRASALELAEHGIRVNAIAPGVTATRMNEALRNDADRSAGLVSRIPMRRFGLPDEQAAAIAFLVSPDAAYITGAILPVDGGWLTS